MCTSMKSSLKNKAAVYLYLCQCVAVKKTLICTPLLLTTVSIVYCSKTYLQPH